MSLVRPLPGVYIQTDVLEEVKRSLDVVLIGGVTYGMPLVAYSRTDVLEAVKRSLDVMLFQGVTDGDGRATSRDAHQDKCRV